MTPIQGNWTISGIDLPADVLEKIYFGNAEKLLARPLAKLAKSATSATPAASAPAPAVTH